MDIDELSRRLERIFIDEWDVYAESPTYLTEKYAAVHAFAGRLEQLSGREVYLEGPQNVNNYFRLQICLTPGLPVDRFDVDRDEIERAGEVVYLNIICSPLAPVAEASWHVYRVEHDQRVLDSYELLDPRWLSRHPEWEALALEVKQIGKETNLCLLSWNVTRRPADPRWPRPEFAPDSAQLRHFLFSGYYDD